MISLHLKAFAWLVLASTLDIVLDPAHAFSVSSGLARSICEQSQNHAEMNQIQPALKSSSMAPKSGSDSDCEWVVMNKPQPPVLKPCSSSEMSEDDLSSPKVVKGEPTEPGEFPSLISIYFYWSPSVYNATYTIPSRWDMRCSAALITEEWIFTRKDCFRQARENQNNSRLRIYAGKYNHTPGTEPDVEQGPSEPTEFVDYPYKPPTKDNTDNLRLKFTLAKISPPFVLNDRVKLARWPKADEGIPKDPMIVVGWGNNNTNPYQGAIPFVFVPYKLTVSAMEQEKCIEVLQSKWKYNVTESEFCLETEPNSGPSVGDDVTYRIDADGGQTVIASGNFWYPKFGTPPVMTRASFLREWVESVVGPLP